MVKKSAFCLLLLCLHPGFAGALEIKNVRLTHGPLGALRNETKFLPGDYLFMTFDIEGLAFDPKTGKASYETELELYDSKTKKIFSKTTPNEISAMLGGTRLPGDLHVIMGRDQAPGKYVVRLIVKDRLNKDLKYHDHRFELMPQGFGLVGVTAPAVGFPGQNYVASFALVDMGLNAQKKPDVLVTMKVLDETGTQPLAKPIYTVLPKDLPDEINLQKENFVPMQFPIYLNRAGRFIVEVDAIDKISQKQTKLRYSLTVLDIASVTGR